MKDKQKEVPQGELTSTSMCIPLVNPIGFPISGAINQRTKLGEPFFFENFDLIDFQKPFFSLPLVTESS